VWPAEAGMLGRGDPVVDDPAELLDGHARVRRRDEVDDPTLAEGRERGTVAVDHGGVRRGTAPLGVLPGEGPDAVADEGGLDVDRLLAPEGAVVIEDGESFFDGDEVGPALVGDPADEVE